MNLVKEKAEQAIKILDELGIDLWLTFVRETSGVRDPAMDYIFGPNDLTWESALIFTRTGRRIAIVGRFEADAVKQLGVYDEVSGYDESIRPFLLEILNQTTPDLVAVNNSRNNVHADGLTHGMYLILQDYLAGTPYAEKLTSAEPIINALRGRKTPAEIALMRKAIQTTNEIYEATFEFMKPGMSEREVGEFMHRQIAQRGLDVAWSYDSCPAVNSGPDSPVGHGAPGDIKLTRGQLVHFDFGVKENGYCSDIQRVIYIPRENESEIPAEIQTAFETLRAAIENARVALKPGAKGVDVDYAARITVTSAGYPEYKYATGHQLGRVAHDGGALLGPQWERYGDSPNQKVELNNVYTLEPGMAVPEYGYMGLEEDVLVTETGAEYLGEPQTSIKILKS